MREGTLMLKVTFKEFESILNKNLLAYMPKDYDISKLASYEIGPCIEILFCVDNDDEYQESWMGKMLDKRTKRNIFWFGLTDDGKQAYNYDSLQEFTDAKVFHGSSSLKDIWDLITLISVDCYVGAYGQLEPY